MKPDENEITGLYRDLIRDAVTDPQVQKDKKAFIERCFPKAPFLLFRPAVYVPAMSFCALFLFFMVFYPAHIHSPEPVPAGTKPAQVVMEEAPLVMARKNVSNLSAAVSRNAVDVKRVASEAGPTMVYQKVTRENVPLTVVWVFAAP